MAYDYWRKDSIRQLKGKTVGCRLRPTSFAVRMFQLDCAGRSCVPGAARPKLRLRMGELVGHRESHQALERAEPAFHTLGGTPV